MGVEYRVLGPLEALVGESPVALGPPRHRALLVLLLAQANTVVPAHRLIDEIWGDAPPASAANLVQGAVSHLRKALSPEAIVTRGPGYVLNVAPNALDLHRFERKAEEGSLALEHGDFARAATTLAAALDLWSGPALRTCAMSCVCGRSPLGWTMFVCSPQSVGSKQSSAAAGTPTFWESSGS